PASRLPLSPCRAPGDACKKLSAEGRFHGELHGAPRARRRIPRRRAKPRSQPGDGGTPRRVRDLLARLRRQGGMSYSAVSDLNATELDEFAALAQEKIRHPLPSGAAGPAGTAATSPLPEPGDRR